MSIPTKLYLQRVTLRPGEDVELDPHPFDIAAVRDVERMRRVGRRSPVFE
jgi:hypothetical protein